MFPFSSLRALSLCSMSTTNNNNYKVNTALVLFTIDRVMLIVCLAEKPIRMNKRAHTHTRKKKLLQK